MEGRCPSGRLGVLPSCWLVEPASNFVGEPLEMNSAKLLSVACFLTDLFGQVSRAFPSLELCQSK